MDSEEKKKQLMSAERWNRSALKPHLVSNGKNIKDYYPQRQKGHEHLPHGVQAKFRGPFLRETEHVFVKKKVFSLVHSWIWALWPPDLLVFIPKKHLLPRLLPILRCWFSWWWPGKGCWRLVYLDCMLWWRSQLKHIIPRLHHLVSPRCTTADAALLLWLLLWPDLTLQ